MATRATMISGGDVVTLDPDRRVFRGGFLLVRDGRIVDLGPADRRSEVEVDERIDARGCVIVPGLINTHQHHWYNLFKGLGDGMSIRQWLFDLLTPAGRTLTAADLGVASALSCLEMISTGTTNSLNHQVSSTDEEKVRAIVEPVVRSGMRQVFAKDVRPQSIDEQLGLAEETYRRWDQAGDGRVRVAFAVESSPTWTQLGGASEELTLRGNDLAVRLGAIITSHLTTGEHVHYLQELGVLNAHWVLAHAIETRDPDFALITRMGASVSHTPTSEASRGGGITPVHQMLAAGVNVALGTDGPMVDTTVDMVEQMKAVRLIQNQSKLDPLAIAPETALEMATIRAAEAIGMADQIGSLEVGKRADLAIFDLDTPHSSVWHKPVSALVHSARGTDARWVMVDGELLIRDGQFTRIDRPTIRELLKEARARSGEAIERAGLTHLLGAPWLAPAGEP